MPRLHLSPPSPVVWLTGLSGAGKTTVATALKARLQHQGHATALLDGDELRTGLCRDLGFSAADRTENTRRVSEVAKLLHEAGLVTLVALISPFAKDREAARDLIGPGFIEVFVDASQAVCERRDPKGLYARARHGGNPLMSGMGSPYEPPETPEIRLDGTGALSVEEQVDLLMEYLHHRGYLSA